MIEAPDKRVRLRPETVPKWDAIKDVTRWTDSETADALADAYMAQHEIKLHAGRGISEGNPSPKSGKVTSEIS